MLVKKYKAEVISIVNSINDIYTVELASLSGRFKYYPGQFMHLSLDEYDPSFEWPESRCFSMQSSPAEENIKFTFSVKGAFTERMSVYIRPGILLDLKLPYGNIFQADHIKEDVVFIAGGTGITPFLSLFADPSFSSYTNSKLYFGVREQRYNLYDAELCQALSLNHDFKISITYQNHEGFIDIDRIIRENSLSCYYFISGPQSMISYFKARLKCSGIADQLIRTDDWE